MHAAGLALVALGCAVIAAASLGALLVGADTLVRLHFVTLVTSTGVPLAAIGLSIESRQPYVVAELLLIALLLFVAGPVLGTATARVVAQNRGILDEDQPE
jgi:multicomponent Na+:H+ antiporter subunit G